MYGAKERFSIVVLLFIAAIASQRVATADPVAAPSQKEEASPSVEEMEAIPTKIEEQRDGLPEKPTDEAANETPVPGTDYDINFYIEDDYSGMSAGADDRAYTAGWRLSFVKALTEFPEGLRPLFGGLVDANSRYSVGFALSQQLYTPDDLAEAAPLPLDQPYAAYLFGSASFHIRNDEVLHSFGIDMGVVGPPALGEQLQTNWHHIFGFQPVNGWKNQLKTETTTLLYYQQKRYLLAIDGAPGNRIFDVVGNVQGALGNVYIYAGVGVQARLGFALHDDFGPTILTPVGVDKFVEHVEPRHPFEAYLFSSFDGRWMGRDLFLDGNTFQSGPSVAKVSLVYDWAYGASARFDEFTLSWRQIIRSREFSLETGPHDFASILLSFNHRF